MRDMIWWTDGKNLFFFVWNIFCNSLTFIIVNGNWDTLSHPTFEYLWSTAGCCLCLLTAAGVRMKQLWSGDVETVNWRSGDGSLIHWTQLCSSSPRCNDINKTINKSYQQERTYYTSWLQEKLNNSPFIVRHFLQPRYIVSVGNKIFYEFVCSLVTRQDPVSSPDASGWPRNIFCHALQHTF